MPVGKNKIKVWRISQTVPETVSPSMCLMMFRRDTKIEQRRHFELLGLFIDGTEIYFQHDNNKSQRIFYWFRQY